MDGLMEPDVGITSFLNDFGNMSRIKGIIKSRYSDFNVYEIDQAGKIVHLTDLGPNIDLSSVYMTKTPTEIPLSDFQTEIPNANIEKESINNNTQTELNIDNVKDSLEINNSEINVNLSPEIPQPDKDYTSNTLSDNIKEEISEFLKSLSMGIFDGTFSNLISLLEMGNLCEADSNVIILPSIDDKKQRTMVHQFFRHLSPKVSIPILSDTVENNQIRIHIIPNKSSDNLSMKKQNKRNKIKMDHRNEQQLQKSFSGNGNFILCHMYKENKDTMECISRIGAALRIPSKCISYAGTKDRRGITVQQIAIQRLKGVSIERLAQLNFYLGKNYNIFLGNFSYTENPLGLGDLQGNHFDLILRQVEFLDVEILTNSIPPKNILSSYQAVLTEAMSTHGFINYFGMQRFGQSKVCPTYKIGIYVLKEQWQDVIHLIMDPRADEHDPIENIRQLWKSEAVSDQYLLDQLPKRWVAERSILYHFTQQNQKKGKHNQIISKNALDTSEPNRRDYLGAFQRIPHEMRLMYLHSFQSLIWNHVASRRIKEYGLKPVIGDFVLIKDHNDNKKQKGLESKKFVFIDDLDDEELSGDFVVEIKTAEQVSEYTLKDVVLPLPGYSIQYPSHLKGYYQELVESHGIIFSTFGTSGRGRGILLTGSYRPLVVVPKDFSCSFIEYINKESNLLENDLDVLRKNIQAKTMDVLSTDDQPKIKDGESQLASNDATLEITEHPPHSQNADTDPTTKSEPLLGLRVQFSLPSSAYATMALREFLRCDTSVSFQRSLN